MKKEYHKYKKLGLIHLSGRLDTVEAGDLKESLPFYLNNSKRLLLDLGQVSYMDSSGLGALLSGLKKAIAKDGDIRLANVRPKVKMTLEITGADRLFKSYPNVAGGLAAWSSEL